jgi:hypothetical protein
MIDVLSPGHPCASATALLTPTVPAAALPAPVLAVARTAVLAAALGSPVHAVARTAVYFHVEDSEKDAFNKPSCCPSFSRR